MLEGQDQGDKIETVLDAAKHCLLSYFGVGRNEAIGVREISRHQVVVHHSTYEAQIGPSHTHKIGQQQMAVTRLLAVACCAVFDIADIIAEIRDEARGYRPQTLAANFADQERVAQAEREEAEEQATAQNQRPAPKKKQPAVYRSYMAGNCQNPDCGEYLGHIETEGGRDRHYCNDKCRVAAYRKRQREAKRAAILQYHGELREYWREHHIQGEVLLRLQEILLQHGKKAARAATDAVLVALAAAEQAGSQEHFRLMDEIMLGGEAIGFPEVRLDEFRIPAGWQGWTDFVSGSTLSTLRLMRGYLYEQAQREQKKALGRRRLEELSRSIPPALDGPEA